MDGIIHIGGTMPRIGTTTVAIQLVLFLKIMGYEAAYVEMNPQDYIWGCENLYADCKRDKLSGKVTIHKVDMYSGDWMPELISGGTHYDYILCDYGNIYRKDFERSQFVDCGAMVIVSGVKPNEIFGAERALRDVILKKAVYVFSFVPKEDEDEIRAMMQDKARETAFMPYAPEPFDGKGFQKEKGMECYMNIMNCVVRILREGEGNGKI